MAKRRLIRRGGNLNLINRHGSQKNYQLIAPGSFEPPQKHAELDMAYTYITQADLEKIK